MVDAHIMFFQLAMERTSLRVRGGFFLDKSRLNRCTKNIFQFENLFVFMNIILFWMGVLGNILCCTFFCLSFFSFFFLRNLEFSINSIDRTLIGNNHFLWTLWYHIIMKNVL